MASGLQLSGYLCPSMVRILVQESDYAGSCYAEESDLADRMKRTNGPTTERRVTPTAVQLGRLMEGMYLQRGAIRDDIFNML